MWQNELYCLLFLLSLTPLLYCSLLIRPKPSGFCKFFRSLSRAAFCLSNVHCFPYGNWFVHHVQVRHGNVTSVRDVVFTTLLCTLCGSNPLRFDDCVLLIFLWTWRVQSLRFHLRPFTCTWSPPAWTVRVGWCGDFAWLRWRHPYLLISSGIISGFFTGIIVRNEECLAVCSLRPIGVFLQPIYFFWLHAVGQNMSWRCSDLFVHQSALNLNISFWRIFVEQPGSSNFLMYCVLSVKVQTVT